jgi:hypothetical protein
MSAPHLGGALNVHGSSSSFSGGHSFAGSSTAYHGGSFNGGFHANNSFGVFHGGGYGYHGGYYGGWHGGWGGYGWRGGWGGCWGCGFGWGWGGWGFGWGWGWGGLCGPSWGWGWPGYSLGYYPYWPGYYGYPGYGVTYGDNGDYSSSNNAPVDNNSGNYNAGSVAPDYSGSVAEPQGSPNDNSDTGNVSASRPTVLLYLKDGTTYAASDYWLQDGMLHYIVNYGGESTLNIDELDLQRTVNENARRGVNFSLHPNPSSVSPQPSSNGSPAAGSSTDQTNHYRAPQYRNGSGSNNGSATPTVTPNPAPAQPTAHTQTASQTL